MLKQLAKVAYLTGWSHEAGQGLTWHVLMRIRLDTHS